MIANLAGGGFAAVAQVALIPFYLGMLGIEAYGLVAIQATLLVVARFCDLGIGTVLNRLVAQTGADADRRVATARTVSTVVLAVSLVGVVAAAMIAICSGPIARHWVHNAVLSDETVACAIAAMGVVVGCQFLQGVLGGVLLGAECHVLLNSVRAGATALGAAGSVVVLLWIDRSVSALFLWTGVVAVVQTLALLGCCHAAVLRDHGWRFVPSSLRNLLAGMGGVGAIHLTGLVLGSVDKAVLSMLLDLADLGYYMLATTVAGCMALAITPVFNTFFPRLSALAVARDEEGLRETYHLGSQVVVVMVAPMAWVLTLFAGPLIQTWTGSAATATAAAPLASMLVLGSFVNGLMYMPYSLQLAKHHHTIGVVVNCGLVMLMVPGLFVLNAVGGVFGTSVAWLACNLIYLAVAAPWTHRRLLPGVGMRWLGADVLAPALAALAVVAVARWLLPMPTGRVATGMVVALVLALSALAAVFAASDVRRRILELIDRVRHG